MKFEKAIVNRISMEEEDVIVTSGCSTQANQLADACTTESFVRYQHCEQLMSGGTINW